MACIRLQLGLICAALFVAGCSGSDQDRTAPAQPRLNPPASNVVASHSVVLSGSAEAGSEVRIYADGGSGSMQVGKTSADRSGQWSFTFDAGNDGTFDIWVTATDDHDNTSPQSNSVNIRLDTTAPGVPTVSAGSGLSVFSATVPLDGTAEVGSSVHIMVDTGSGYTHVATESADDQGLWQHDYAAADGAYQIAVIAIDAAGNASSQSSPLQATIDSTAPDAPTLQLVGAAVQATLAVDLVGSAESGATVQVLRQSDGQVAGSATVDAAGSWALTWNASTDGPYDLQAQSIDAAGNTSGLSPAVHVVLDVTPPSVPTLSNAGPAEVAGDVVLEGTSDVASTLHLYVDDGTGSSPLSVLTPDATGTWQYTLAAPSEGTWVFTARAADSIGNFSAMTPAVEVRVDYTPPVAAPVVTAPTGFALNHTEVLLAGTIGEDADRVLVLDADGNAQATLTAAAGAWNWTTPSLADGMHLFELRALDPADNRGPAALVRFEVDTQPPTADAHALTTQDPTPSVSGLAADSGSGVEAVEVSVDGQVQSAAVNPATGEWSALIAQPLAAATYDIGLTVTDAAGNSAVTLAAGALTIGPGVLQPPVVLSPVSGTSSSNPLLVLSGTADASAAAVVITESKSGREPADLPVVGGSWSWVPQQPWADGVHHLGLHAENAAGRTSGSIGLQFTIDTMPPQIDASPRASNATPLTLAGSVADAVGSVAAVRVSLDGTDCGPATVLGSTWTLTTTPPADGVYALTVSATDAVGNSASATYDDHVTVDRTDPWVLLPAQLVTTGTPTITGTAGDLTSSVAHVEVLVDGQTLDASFTVASGTWGADVPSGAALGDGIYDIRATVRDAAGNAATLLVPDGLVVDLDAPQATVNSLVTADATPTIGGTLYDHASGVTSLVVSVDGTALPASSVSFTADTWSADCFALSPGLHEVSVTATDAASRSGQDATSQELDVRDGSTLFVTVDPLTTNDDTPLITGTCGTVDSVTVNIGTENDLATITGHTWEYQVSFPLAEQTHTASAQAVSGLDAVNDSADIVVDQTVPAAWFTPAQTADASPLLQGSLSQAAADATVSVVVQGRTYAATVNNDAWTADVTGLLSEGTHDVVTHIADLAGNTATDTSAGGLLVDLTPPDFDLAPQVNLTGDLVLTGTCADAGAGVQGLQVRIEHQTYNAIISGNTWQASVGRRDDGVYDVTVTAFDQVGNTRSFTFVQRVIVDTLPPVVEIDHQQWRAGHGTLAVSVTDAGTGADTVEIEVAGSTYPAHALSNSVWEAWIPPEDMLADRAYDVVARATDHAGRLGQDTSQYELYVESEWTVEQVDLSVSCGQVLKWRHGLRKKLLGTLAVDVAIDEGWELVIDGPVTIGDDAGAGSLTLPAGGTVYFCANQSPPSMLQIARGAVLNAVGSPIAPIVFTSDRSPEDRQPGDWGGVVINGRAKVVSGGTYPAVGVTGPHNTGPYGGNDKYDGSGEFSYLLIRYAGQEHAGQRLAGLTLHAVGLNTFMNDIATEDCAGDGVCLVGGIARLRHVAVRDCAAAAMRWQHGWRGQAQFGVLRSSSTGVALLAVDNTIPTQGAPSRPVLANLTLFGQTEGVGAHLQEASAGVFHNSILLGLDQGIDIDGTQSWDNAYTTRPTLSGELTLTNWLIHDCVTPFVEDDPDVLSQFVLSENTGNAQADPLLVAPYDPTAPDLRPQPGSPALGAGWQGPDTMDTVSYIGAMDGTNDWTRPWLYGARQPRVAQMQPQDGSTDVPALTPLRVRFSDPMRVASLDPGDVVVQDDTGAPLDCHFLWTSTVYEADTLLILLDNAAPAQPTSLADGLAAGGSYVLQVGTGVENAWGQTLAAPEQSAFTVASRSEVTVRAFVSGIDLGQNLCPAAYVEKGDRILFQFDPQQDYSAPYVEMFSEGKQSSYEMTSERLRWEQTMAPRYQLSLQLDSSLPAGTQALFRVAARDEQGDVVHGEVMVQVEQSASEDDVPPAVLALVPADGDVQIHRLRPLQIMFSEPVAQSTLDAVQISGPGLRSDDFSVQWIESFDGLALLQPRVALPAGATVRVTIPHTIADLAGNTLGTDVSYSFTVAEPTDTGKPVIALSRPTEGATLPPADADEIWLKFVDALTRRYEEIDPLSLSPETMVLRQLETGAVVQGFLLRHDAELPSVIGLSGGATLSEGRYALHVSGVRDVAGNVMDPATLQFRVSTEGHSPQLTDPPTAVATACFGGRSVLIEGEVEFTPADLRITGEHWGFAEDGVFGEFTYGNEDPVAGYTPEGLEHALYAQGGLFTMDATLGHAGYASTHELPYLVYAEADLPFALTIAGSDVPHAPATTPLLIADSTPELTWGWQADAETDNRQGLAVALMSIGYYGNNWSRGYWLNPQDTSLEVPRPLDVGIYNWFVGQLALSGNDVIGQGYGMDPADWLPNTFIYGPSNATMIDRLYGIAKAEFHFNGSMTADYSEGLYGFANHLIVNMFSIGVYGDADTSLEVFATDGQEILVTQDDTSTALRGEFVRGGEMFVVAEGAPQAQTLLLGARHHAPLPANVRDDILGTWNFAAQGIVGATGGGSDGVTQALGGTITLNADGTAEWSMDGEGSSGTFQLETNATGDYNGFLTLGLEGVAFQGVLGGENHDIVCMTLLDPSQYGIGNYVLFMARQPPAQPDTSSLPGPAYKAYGLTVTGNDGEVGAETWKGSYQFLEGGLVFIQSGSTAETVGYTVNAEGRIAIGDLMLRAGPDLDTLMGYEYVSENRTQFVILSR